jgi:hypothetical protein
MSNGLNEGDHRQQCHRWRYSYRGDYVLPSSQPGDFNWRADWRGA